MPLFFCGDEILIFGFTGRITSRIGLLRLRRVVIADDVAISGFYNRIWTINADFDLPTLSVLSGFGRVIADVVLSPQFFCNACKSVFQADIRFGAEQSAARSLG